jgi:hypothetical protein
MKKAVIAAYAVIIVLLVAILAVVALDYWNISFPTPLPTPTPTPKPTATPTPAPTPTPKPTPRPTPTPINYAQTPGELTIISAEYLGYFPPICQWGGSPQLYVRFNWTGQSFTPPNMTLSVGKYAQWWSSYVINHNGNRDPIILANIRLYDYAPTAMVELAFFEVNATIPFKAAYFPISNAGIVDTRPSPTPAPTPTPTPIPTPTPSPMQVDPVGQIVITSVTDYTGKYMPLAITFNWTGGQSYVPRIRVTAGSETYWHNAMTVYTGENGLSVYRSGYPRLALPSGMQVELAFFDVTGDTPFRTAHYTVP